MKSSSIADKCSIFFFFFYNIFHKIFYGQFLSNHNWFSEIRATKNSDCPIIGTNTESKNKCRDFITFEYSTSERLKNIITHNILNIKTNCIRNEPHEYILCDVIIICVENSDFFFYYSKQLTTTKGCHARFTPIWTSK